MIISEQINQLLNYRIEQEEMSSRLYFAMSVWLDFKGYSGAASLFKKYSDEELVHAAKVYDYLTNLNILPIVPLLEQPQIIFMGLPDIINKALQHEIDISNQCNDLAKAADMEGDFMTLELAQWLCKEQNEELGKTQYWVDRLAEFGSDPVALRLMDDEMGKI